MPKRLITIIGKTIQKATTLRGGGGSALPGLVIEKIDKKYSSDILKNLPKGVVIISGTNGKTTTTKIVVELLEFHGLKVFTNRTGSNFARGITSALLSEVGISGKLKADIAVLELDEAHAVSFIKDIKPTYSLILNVLRDQLDRYGEIDKTAKMLSQVVQSTKRVTVLNREDTLVSNMDKFTINSPKYFGLDESMSGIFTSDSELHGKSEIKTEKKADVILRNFSDKNASFEIDNKIYSTDLSIQGIYNVYNITAAICLVKEILGEDFNIEKTISKISSLKPSFGRGEKIKIKNTTVEIVLVKNPAGFKLALSSYDNNISDVMIALNDNYADSRDVSWIWDVDFTSLKNIKPFVTGSRAYDMSLRLKYDDVNCEFIDSNISKSLNKFIKSYPDRPKRIYCTYTAMLQIRKKLTGSSLEEIK